MYRAFTAVNLHPANRTFTEGVEIDASGTCLIVAGTLIQETTLCFDAFKVIVEGDRFTVFKQKGDSSRRWREQDGYQIAAILERVYSHGVYGPHGYTWYQFVPEMRVGSPPERKKPYLAVFFGILALLLLVLAFLGLPGLLLFAFPAAWASARAAKGENGVLYEEDLPILPQL